MLKRFFISCSAAVVVAAAGVGAVALSAAPAYAHPSIKQPHPVRVAPNAGAAIVGWVVNPDCRTIGVDTAGGRVPRYVEGEGRVWYKVGNGWVLNTGWCI